MKSNFATGNRLQEIGNRLPESKNSGNLENFEKNSFEKQNCAMFVFWKISSILPLRSLLDFFSWILKSNFSWFLNLLDFFSWNLKLILNLNLLTQPWNHSLGIFVIIFVIIKTPWINLDSSSWINEVCFYTDNSAKNLFRFRQVHRITQVV